MKLDVVPSLDSWFSNKLQGLRCSPETLAYVTGVMSQKRWDNADMSTQSLVLAYRDAVLADSFAGFQRLGDWVLFIDITCPLHIDTTRDIVESLARQSYYSCYRIMMRRWRLYEELADGLPQIASNARRLLTTPS